MSSAESHITTLPPKIPPTTDQPTPMQLIQLALQNGLGVEVLKGLYELQQQARADEARSAFVAAMSQFKANPPRVTKNKAVSYGNTNYKHATLDNVCDSIGSALAKVGISYRWETQQNEHQITVTCILTHELGHSERTTLSSAPDTSGSKNSIQAIGSAVTYLQRYTLLSITGLASEDDDGASATSDVDLSEELEYIANSRNKDELQKFYLAAYKKASLAKDKAAQMAVIAATNARKAELSCE